MSLTRILLNIIGFLLLLEGCLGVTSPELSKSIFRYLIGKVDVKLIRLYLFGLGAIFVIIFWGAINYGPAEKIFGDYLMIIGVGFFGLFYLSMAFSLPKDLLHSEIVNYWLEMSNFRFRIYELGSLILGIFAVLISVRY